MTYICIEVAKDLGRNSASVLQCVAVMCCSVLQCVAVMCCSVLQCVAAKDSFRHFTQREHISALWSCVVVFCGVVQGVAERCNVLQYRSRE